MASLCCTSIRSLWVGIRPLMLFPTDSTFLHAAEIQLCVLFADFTEPDYRRQYEDAIAAGIAARVDAVVIYVINPSAFRESVAKARAAGIPVFSFVRPDYPVNASVIYPNFNQGVFMAGHLVALLEKGSGVAVIGARIPWMMQKWPACVCLASSHCSYSMTRHNRGTAI
jgi:ABC-type sugar transport system substrate-binding protein